MQRLHVTTCQGDVTGAQSRDRDAESGGPGKCCQRSAEGKRSRRYERDDKSTSAPRTRVHQSPRSTGGTRDILTFFPFADSASDVVAFRLSSRWRATGSGSCNSSWVWDSSVLGTTCMCTAPESWLASSRLEGSRGRVVVLFLRRIRHVSQAPESMKRHYASAACSLFSSFFFLRLLRSGFCPRVESAINTKLHVGGQTRSDNPRSLFSTSGSGLK